MEGKPARKQSRARAKPHRTETTLACFIQALEGRKMVVELRNDVIIRGTLDSSDDFMNLTMSQVSYQTVQGSKAQYATLYVKGRNIRFVHMPKTLDPAQLVEAQRLKLQTARITEYKARQQLGRLGKEEVGGSAPAEVDSLAA